VTVELVPINGGYDDIVNKLSLLYRSPATAPDIAEMATPTVDQFASCQPKTWDDILNAARVVKAKLAGIIPLWILAGTAPATTQS
jgi:hypothetical protein